MGLTCSGGEPGVPLEVHLISGLKKDCVTGSAHLVGKGCPFWSWLVLIRASRPKTQQMRNTGPPSQRAVRRALTFGHAKQGVISW